MSLPAPGNIGFPKMPVLINRRQPPLVSLGNLPSQPRACAYPHPYPHASRICFYNAGRNVRKTIGIVALTPTRIPTRMRAHHPPYIPPRGAALVAAPLWTVRPTAEGQGRDGRPRPINRAQTGADMRKDLRDGADPGVGKGLRATCVVAFVCA